MITKVEGIIVSEVDYKESSKIVNIFTKEHGIIGALARGAKRLKSNLAGVASKLTYGTFYINYKEKGLSILSEVDIINSFKNIKKDLERYLLLGFLGEYSPIFFILNVVSSLVSRVVGENPLARASE